MILKRTESIKLQDSLLLYKKNADMVLELAGVRLLGWVAVEYFSKFKSASASHRLLINRT